MVIIKHKKINVSVQERTKMMKNKHLYSFFDNVEIIVIVPFGMKHRDSIHETFLESKIKMRKNSLIQLHVISSIHLKLYPFQLF